MWDNRLPSPGFSRGGSRYVEQIKHRGPDGHGLVDLPAGSLGHTRRAILDVAGGQQPQPLKAKNISGSQIDPLLN